MNDQKSAPRTSRVRRALIPLSLLAALGSYCAASGAMSRDSGDPSPSMVIDLLGGLTKLPRQSHGEHLEQIRDWARLAVAARSDAIAGGTGAITGVLSDQAVVRRPELGNALAQQYGPARSFVEGTRGAETLHVIVSGDAAEHRDELAGAEYARYLALVGRRPARVQIHDLDIDLPRAEAAVRDEAAVDAAAFELGSGKLSVALIDSEQSLASFLSRSPDLVAAECTPEGLRVTGRDGVTSGAGLSPEYIAALYQPPAFIRKPLPAKDEKIALGISERMAMSDEQLTSEKSNAEVVRALVNEARRRAALYDGHISRLEAARWVIADHGRAEAPGFSLDPVDDDISELLKRLRLLASGRGLDERIRRTLAQVVAPESVTRKMASRDFRDQVRARLNELAKVAAQKGNFERIKAYLQADDHETEAQEIAAQITLDLAIETEYQCARYEGSTRGTLAGMSFFYTDLLAKLWAIDYGGHVPSDQIPGLIPAAGTPVSAEACANGGGKSARIWFGMREEAVRPMADGRTVFFDRVGVRVFAKGRDLGSNPRSETERVRPHVRRFIGWFDANYQTVAREEHQYEALNQIMKWSALLAWSTDQSDCFQHLGFLDDVKVNRELRFEQWAKSNQSLLGYPVNELPRERSVHGRETECIPVLQSAFWDACGRTISLSGGVGTPRAQDVRALPKRAPQERGTLASPLAPVVIDEGNGKHLLASDTEGKVARRLIEAHDNSLSITDIVGKDATRNHLLGTAVEGTRITREARLAGDALMLQQSVAGEMLEQLKLNMDSGWTRVGIELVAAPETIVAKLADRITARQSTPGKDRSLAAIVRDALPGTEHFEIDDDRVIVASKPGGGFVELRRARGPPEAPSSDGGAAPPRGPRWHGSGTTGADDTGNIFWRNYEGPNGKDAPPPPGNYKNHVAAEAHPSVELLLLLQAAVDANDAAKAKSTAEKLRTAPARGPPGEYETAEELMMNMSVRARRAGQADEAAELEKIALDFGRRATDTSLPPTPGSIQDNEFTLAGHAERVEPIELMGLDGSLRVDATLAADGLLTPAKASPENSTRKLLEQLLPRSGEHYPRIELVRLRLPPGPGGDTPRIRAGKHAGGPIERMTAPEHQAVGGVTTRSAMGSRSRAEYSEAPVSWRQLVAGQDKTQLGAAFFYPCDLNRDGTVSRDEWITCRCDTDFDQNLSDAVEQTCAKEMGAWLDGGISFKNWLERRCAPSEEGRSSRTREVICMSQLAGDKLRPAVK